MRNFPDFSPQYFNIDNSSILQGSLSVVAHNRKVVGALSVVGATESQIVNNFLENSLKFQQNLWISGNHLQFAEIPGKIRENFNEKQQI